jgi:hypothetical protein
MILYSIGTLSEPPPKPAEEQRALERKSRAPPYSQEASMVQVLCVVWRCCVRSVRGVVCGVCLCADHNLCGSASPFVHVCIQYSVSSPLVAVKQQQRQKRKQRCRDAEMQIARSRAGLRVADAFSGC